jgi:phage I-like protein
MKHGSLFFALNMEQGKAPTRIQILPSGVVVQGRDGRSWTNPDPATVVAASNADLPRHVIDENHATDLKAPRGEDAPAYGWFFNLSLNETGETWADVEWTDRGRAAVESLEYRYISPVFDFDPQGRIIRVKRAALSNAPNLRLEALNSEDPSSGREEKNMKGILAVLGLADTATEQDAIAAIATLKTAQNAQKPVDLTLYAPRADLQAMETRALNAEGSLKKIQDDGIKAKGLEAVEKAIADRKIAPASKNEYLALCSTQEGLDKFTAIIAVSPEIIPAKPAVPSETPPESQTALNAEEVAYAKAAGYTAEEWKKMKEKAK